jgi:hypothetical protein
VAACAVAARVAARVAEAADARRKKMAKVTGLLTASALAMLVGVSIAATTSQAPKSFASPQEGFGTLVTALRANDTKTLKNLLGPEGDSIISSGDPVADMQRVKDFLASYDAHSKIETPEASRAVLEVGADEWPLPIPMVKEKSGWQFDAAAGKEELLARRIGRNEIYTIQACLAYVDAQREYAQKDHGDGLLDYAQRFVSTPNKQDGLYWPTPAGAPQSPLGPEFARAQSRGYTLDKNQSGAVPGHTPYNGYYFRILKGQGPSAPGGAYSYLAGKRMIGGFALVAYPVHYGVSGVMTFLVNHDGVVYQNDLGANTSAIAEKMTVFDPGKGWKKSASV